MTKPRATGTGQANYRGTGQARVESVLWVLRGGVAVLCRCHCAAPKNFRNSP